jgi:hypothetical protein
MTLPDPSDRPLTRPRILVVEDEALVAADLEDRLERSGYEVCGRADTADDAVEAALATRPDLVLMDIHLIGPRDGVDAAGQLRTRSDVPVVFLTAHADESTLSRAGTSEPFGYVLKPFDERELRATVEMALYRSRAERRLRKMERWLATTLGSIGEGVIATDRLGRINFINAVGEALTGWPRGEALGRDLIEVFVVEKDGEPGALPTLFAQAMTEGSSISLGDGHFLRTRDGQRRVLDESIAAVRDDDGQITGAVVIFRDATDRKKAEEDRRRLEEKMHEAVRLESLGALASGIAHDFNNLLTVITCNATLGQAVAPEGSPLMKYLTDMQAAADRASDLCSQILAYAGQARMLAEAVELSTFIRERAPLLKKGIAATTEIELDLADDLPLLRGDRSQLQQVIANLLLNGSEALAGQPGKLVVATRRFLATPDFLATCRQGSDLPPGEYLSLEVRDDGQGMSEATLARMFDPFFTTKFAGRGLGLSAVQGIVRLHGGALAVESTPGVGTTFRVLFPELEQSASALAIKPGSADWQSSGRVLVIDDDESVRLVASAALQSFGLDVELAVDGREGLEKVREIGATLRFVMLDMTMPHLDGRGVLQGIRAQFPELPVALVSGYSTDKVEDLLQLGGPTIFIPKPFTLDALAARLSALVGEAG